MGGKQHRLTQFPIRKTKRGDKYLRLSCWDILPSHYFGKTCDPSPASSCLTVTCQWRDHSRAASRVADLCLPWCVWGWRCSAGAALFGYYLSMCSSVLSVALLWLWTAASLTTVSIATACSIVIVSPNKNVPISYAEVIGEHHSQRTAGIEGTGMSVVCWLLTGSWKDFPGYRNGPGSLKPDGS